MTELLAPESPPPAEGLCRKALVPDKRDGAALPGDPQSPTTSMRNSGIVGCSVPPSRPPHPQPCEQGLLTPPPCCSPELHSPWHPGLWPALPAFCLGTQVSSAQGRLRHQDRCPARTVTPQMLPSSLPGSLWRVTPLWLESRRLPKTSCSHRWALGKSVCRCDPVLVQCWDGG